MRAGGQGDCQIPSCTNTRHVDIHHVHHHADGGPTDRTKLIPLFSWHHRELHRNGWRVTTTRSPGTYQPLPHWAVDTYVQHPTAA